MMTMMRGLLCLLLFVCCGQVWAQEGVDGQLPSLYDYYTAGGIKSGLNTTGVQFGLNGKPFLIYGGSLHYFRVVPDRWADLLARFKAAGLNTVQLYVPWNLHEDTPSAFDFQSPRLNLGHFLDLIKANDMFAVVRPGPYICAEWEFGGLPSWLLKGDPKMKLREYYQPYLDKVRRYWGKVMGVINQYQFTSGGPVIMLQIENEYFGAPIPHNLTYIEYLLNLTRSSGFTQPIFTSDGISVAVNDPVRSIKELLETANLNDDTYAQLTKFRTAQPDRPVYASEFWPGWFDSWGDQGHHVYPPGKFWKQASDILFRVNGSLNYYVFIGGTNFGFMNGGLPGNPPSRVVTSYDYDAPLTESGNYTGKYGEVRELYELLVATGRLPLTRVPNPPPVQPVRAYGELPIYSYYTFEDLLAYTWNFKGAFKPVSMENFDVGPEIAPGVGQRYGFALYRVITSPSVKKYTVAGPVADRGIFMVDGNQTAVIQDAQNFSAAIGANNWSPDLPADAHHLDMLVENMGRANWGDLVALGRKGIDSNISLDGTVWRNFTLYALDFNETFVNFFNGDSQLARLAKSREDPGPRPKVLQPRLYNTQLEIAGNPTDTYLALPGWTKGNVFVNGFNLGRYWSVGPQKTLYIPAPLLKKGRNHFNVFELHEPGEVLQFLDRPILGPPITRSDE